MEASVSLEVRERPSGVAVATPKLKVVEGGKKQRRPRPNQRSRSNFSRLRLNSQALVDEEVPEGHTPCLVCRTPIPFKLGSYEDLVCPKGHVLSQSKIMEIEEVSPGGVAHSGISKNEQGRIGEEIVWDLADLGEYGRPYSISDSYHCPLDGATDKNWGIEVKSVSTLTRCHAFAPTKKQKASKDRFARDKGYQGVIGVLVVLDFATSRAEIYLKAMKRVVYFEKPKTAFATSVPFDNPLLPQVAVENPDMPF